MHIENSTATTKLGHLCDNNFRFLFDWAGKSRIAGVDKVPVNMAEATNCCLSRLMMVDFILVTLEATVILICVMIWKRP